MTKHNDTCKMAFGRYSKHDNCPRCQELKAGAEPVKWAKAHRGSKAADTTISVYCFSVSMIYSRCTKESNPSCACGKMSYTD